MWVAVRLFGLSIFSLTLVRLLVLGSIHVALYALARRLPGACLAPLTCFSLFLIPVFAWNAANYLTHTLLLCAVFLATVRQVLLLPGRRHTRSYVLLGLWLGLDLLSKYNGALFATALLLAALSCPRYRECLADRRLLLTVALATVLVLPHGLWRAARWDASLGTVGVQNERGRAAHADRDGTGTVESAAQRVAAAAAACRRPGSVVASPAGGRAASRGRAGRLSAVGAFLLHDAGAAGAVASGQWQSRRQGARLQPLLVVAPAYCFSRLRRRRLGWRQLRLAAGMVVVLALAVLGGQASRIVWGSRDKGVYPLQMSFDAVAQCWQSEGIGEATLVVPDRTLAGNLRCASLGPGSSVPARSATGRR